MERDVGWLCPQWQLTSDNEDRTGLTSWAGICQWSQGTLDRVPLDTQTQQPHRLEAGLSLPK
jgi:hypothetical protein